MKFTKQQFKIVHALGDNDAICIYYPVDKSSLGGVFLGTQSRRFRKSVIAVAKKIGGGYCTSGTYISLRKDRNGPGEWNENYGVPVNATDILAD
jgi:hypothetical protein